MDISFDFHDQKKKGKLLLYYIPVEKFEYLQFD